MAFDSALTNVSFNELFIGVQAKAAIHILISGEETMLHLLDFTISSYSLEIWYRRKCDHSLLFTLVWDFYCSIAFKT